MNEQQLLRNPEIEPTNEVLADALGPANSVYKEFLAGLPNRDIQVDWRYYTDGKAWLAKGLHKWVGVRGGQNEVTAFWLSIWDGYFKVTFYIPEKTRLEALGLPLSDTVKGMMADARQMGKLKFFPLTFEVKSIEFLSDIYTITDFRKTIK